LVIVVLQKKCQVRHPPGDEIYGTSTVGDLLEQGDDPSISNQSIAGGADKVQTLAMYEVDGRKSKMYCQVCAVGAATVFPYE
jgi:hypothetical protein